MQIRIMIAVTAAAMCCPPVWGQRRVDPRNRGERIVAVVPMVGSGTPGDPTRPLFAPMPSEMRASGIYEFSYQISDDGKNAIVELAARNSSAFAAILRDSRTVKAFNKGKHKRDDIEKELKKHKKDFTFGPPLSGTVALPGVTR